MTSTVGCFAQVPQGDDVAYWMVKIRGRRVGERRG